MRLGRFPTRCEAKWVIRNFAKAVASGGFVVASSHVLGVNCNAAQKLNWRGEHSAARGAWSSE